MTRDWKSIDFNDLSALIAGLKFDECQDDDLSAMLERNQGLANSGGWVGDQARRNVPVLHTEIARRRQTEIEKTKAQKVGEIGNQVGQISGQITTLNEHAASVDGKFTRLNSHVANIDGTVGGMDRRLRVNETKANRVEWIAIVGLLIAALALARDIFDWNWPRKAPTSQAPPIQVQLATNATESTMLPATNPLPTGPVTNSVVISNVPVAAPITNVIPFEPTETNQP